MTPSDPPEEDGKDPLVVPSRGHEGDWRYYSRLVMSMLTDLRASVGRLFDLIKGDGTNPGILSRLDIIEETIRGLRAWKKNSRKGTEDTEDDVEDLRRRLETLEKKAAEQREDQALSKTNRVVLIAAVIGAVGGIVGAAVALLK